MTLGEQPIQVENIDDFGCTANQIALQSCLQNNKTKNIDYSMTSFANKITL